MGNSAHSGKTRDNTEGTEWLCNSRNSHRELLSLWKNNSIGLMLFFLSSFYLFVLFLETVALETVLELAL